MWCSRPPGRCQRGKPLASTSPRQQSASGYPMFMSRKKMPCPGACREAPTPPAVGHAERWSPNTSSLPPQRHWRGACGKGSRKRRSSNTRMQSLERRNSVAVGTATTARGPPGPACDKRRARDAGSRSRKRLSSAVLSKLAVAECCHPRSGSPSTRGRRRGWRPARHGRLLPTAAGRNLALAGQMPPE